MYVQRVWACIMLTGRRFVGLGEDPHVLAQRAPPLFTMIQQHYPHVTTSVHGV